MDDSGFVILCFVFWIVVNSIVGYLIGKRKNDAAGGLILGLLLGPIGWLIEALSAGNLRKTWRYVPKRPNPKRCAED